jgi:hypothetical protein
MAVEFKENFRVREPLALYEQSAPRVRSDPRAQRAPKEPDDVNLQRDSHVSPIIKWVALMRDRKGLSPMLIILFGTVNRARLRRVVERIVTDLADGFLGS